ncbi:Cationic peroxidase 1 [Glycine soja]
MLSKILLFFSRFPKPLSSKGIQRDEEIRRIQKENKANVKNKEIRSKQVIPHTGGSKANPRRRNELEQIEVGLTQSIVDESEVSPLDVVGRVLGNTRLRASSLSSSSSGVAFPSSNQWQEKYNNLESAFKAYMIMKEGRIPEELASYFTPDQTHSNDASSVPNTPLDARGSSGSSQLSSDFYSTTCPNALSTIKSVVDSAVSNEARMGASLLRLHFHDCFGCDASVLLNDTTSFTGEQTARGNVNSIRGFGVIDNIKSQVESLCPGVVSCADILAVAARDSVVALGGPSWTVQLGRRDSTTASLSSANSDLPRFDLSLQQLSDNFQNKGLTTAEMVALSGGHTIGQAQCSTFRTRIYNETNIDSSFATSLQANCPSVGGDSNLAPLDSSQNTFDNAYFKDLQSQKGLLHTDQVLFNGGSTDSQVNGYASDPSSFNTDFANAMIKMGNISPLTGSSGEIRTNCWKTN